MTCRDVPVLQVSLKMQECAITEKHKEIKFSGLGAMDFPADVISMAEWVLSQLKATTYRGKNESKRKFFCFQQAYCHISIRDRNPAIVPNPREIAQKVGLDIKDIQGAMTMFSNSYKTGYKPVSVYVNPLGSLTQYAMSLGFNEDAKNSLLQVGKRVIDRAPHLMEDKPLAVAAGILNYYVSIYNTGHTKTDVERVTGYVGATLANFTEEVARVDN